MDAFVDAVLASLGLDARPPPLTRATLDSSSAERIPFENVDLLLVEHAGIARALALRESWLDRRRGGSQSS